MMLSDETNRAFKPSFQRIGLSCNNVYIAIDKAKDRGWKTTEGSRWMTTSFLTVGATRLERATAWSQTRSATNCATPRKAAAKVHLSAEMTKSNRLFLGKDSKKVAKDGLLLRERRDMSLRRSACGQQKRRTQRHYRKARSSQIIICIICAKFGCSDFNS